MKKVLKVLGIIIAIPVVIILLGLIIALFVKKDYAIERQITIAKPSTAVFDYIKYVKNQDHFSKWNLMDSAMKKWYKGTDATVGFVAGWESKNKDLGIGEQEILKIVEGERIETKLRFKTPFEAQDDAYLSTTATDSTHTLVKWGFKGAFDYPMNIMGLFINMDKEVGGDLEIGLKNLKVVLEK